MTIRNQRAFAAGAFFVACAAFYLWQALDYDTGSVATMGPGFVPLMLGAILAVIGLVVMGGAVAPHAAREALEAWNLRGLAWITAAIVAFAFLLPRLGLILSVVVLVVMASAANREFRWLSTMVTAVVLAVFSLATFAYGLGLPFPLWPTTLD